MSGGLSKLQLLIIASAIIGIVLFLLAPRTSKEAQAVDPTERVEVDRAVQEAVQMVQQGERPMEGILKLREILENDPANIDAAYQLGLFSIQSGQYENAIKRFGQVVEQDTGGRYIEAYVYLGKTYAELGDREKAVLSLKKYIELESDPAAIEQAEAMIAELE